MVTETPVWHAAYRAARERAAIFPLRDAGILEVSGPERLAYLNDLITNKVDDLAPGACVRAFLLSPTKGRVLADFLVCETGESTWLECAGGCAPTVLDLLRKYYFGQEVEFRDRSGEWRVWSLQGPRAGEILTGLVTDVPPAAPGEHEAATMGADEIRVVRWSDTGLPGYHIWVPAESADAARTALEGAGAGPGHPGAWTVLQIEGGVPAYGRELTEEVIPLEAPTEEAIDHGKGCYPGQEVIARLWARGRPARRLRGLNLGEGEPPETGAVLDAEDKPGVARVTASGRSPDLGPIALAYVHRDYCEAGTRLSADGGSAEVVDLPMREGLERP